MNCAKIVPEMIGLIASQKLVSRKFKLFKNYCLYLNLITFLMYNVFS